MWWGQEDDKLDLLSQVHDRTVQVDILQNDSAAGAKRVRIVSQLQVRHYTYQELTLLAELSGFKVRL